jgi:hypothetical protein
MALNGCEDPGREVTTRPGLVGAARESVLVGTAPSVLLGTPENWLGLARA